MTVRQCAEIGMAIALAIVLGAITRLVQLPYGGSINLSGLPIIAMALRHGVKFGATTGALFGIVDFMLNPYYFHPVQVVLDYPLAFALLGAGTGIAAGAVNDGRARMRIIVLGSLFVAGVMRLAIHWVSGMVFFANFAPEGQPVWLYSLTYNSSYVIPEVISYMLLSQFILRFINSAHRKVANE
ncbi:MAG: energy-coupled thiamine transporter ThiT [Candidatus Latescibacterota bacterium]|jgi:thiamine transporter